MCVAVLHSACSEQKPGLFTKLDSDDTGIAFINQNHETELSNILTYEYFYNGGGVALGDINNDGLTDIYFTSNIFENKLYLNEGNFHFKDITDQSGTACAVGWKTGVTMADVNADGLLDIYVSRSASPDPERRRNILLINKGNLTFVDEAKQYGLDDQSYSTQAAFFDFDRDDDLDVVLLNHSLLEISNSFNINVKNTDARFPNTGNKLYQNDDGHFVDVSDTLGVFGSAFNYGLGISLSDVNNDGWIDMYAGCDYTGRDRLLNNEQGKFFRDVTHSHLSHISKFTMGTDIADINADGNMDILTLDMLPEDNHRQKQLMGSDRYDVFNTMVKNGLHAQYMRNMLHLNNGDGTFSEIGQLAGIANTDWSWGALIQDYDNDGSQDIFISNGFKRDLTNNDFAKYTAAQEIAEARKKGETINALDVIGKFEENKIPNYMFQGNEDLTFSNVTDAWGLGGASITNGIAYGDLDNDGDLDIVTNNMNEEAGIYRNNSESSKNNFLSIRLKGLKNTFSIGARVTVFTQGNKKTVEQLPVRGFQSSVDFTLHVGLGSTDKVDSVYVRWPSGGCSTIKNVTINEILTVDEVSKVEIRGWRIIQPPFFSVTDTIGVKVRENEFNDFNTQPLLPRMYSTLGPALAIGDINNDGLQDVFLGGPKGVVGQLLIQNKNGEYKPLNQKVFDNTRDSEDIDAVFFDMDADQDLDLYVVTGGYEFQRDDKVLADALYENEGKGNFISKQLPVLLQSGSCVRPADVDNDQDLDLFIGGRIIPGRYPETPESYILTNDGKGNFSISDKNSLAIKNAGMVSDALWLDLNKDNLSDLVLVGEWMPVKVFINSSQGLIDQSSAYIKETTEGFWNCLAAEDFDHDGDKDLVIGNYGLNTQLRASSAQPVKLVYADFDKNGSVDPILNYFIKDNIYPYPTRDELMEQIPSFKKRFTNYDSYADVTIEEVLTPEEINSSNSLVAYSLQTCYFENVGDHFDIKPLPLPFQFSPIFALATFDINRDGHPDIISGGNLSAVRARSGKLTGNYGTIAFGDGKGNFTVASMTETGLKIMGDVRHMVLTDGDLMITINNGHTLRFRNE
jgi:hypothetical protein